jgi:hypothetical protein
MFVLAHWYFFPDNDCLLNNGGLRCSSLLSGVNRILFYKMFLTDGFCSVGFTYGARSVFLWSLAKHEWKTE